MKKLFVLLALFSFLAFSEGGSFFLSLNETLYHPGDFTKFTLEPKVQCYQDRQQASNALIDLVKNAKEGLDGIFGDSGFEYEVQTHGFSLSYRNWNIYGYEKEDPCQNTWEGSQVINIKIYEVGDEIINNFMNSLYWLTTGYNSTQDGGTLQYVKIGNPQKGLLPSTIEALTFTGERILKEKAVSRFLNFIGNDYNGYYAITNISLGNFQSNITQSYELGPVPPVAGGVDSAKIYVDLDDIKVNVSASVSIWYSLDYKNVGGGIPTPGMAIPVDTKN